MVAALEIESGSSRSSRILSAGRAGKSRTANPTDQKLSPPFGKPASDRGGDFHRWRGPLVRADGNADARKNAGRFSRWRDDRLGSSNRRLSPSGLFQHRNPSRTRGCEVYRKRGRLTNPV